MQTDWQLIDKYLREPSDAAFSALVARHRNLVYSVCARELGDAALAEDAAQIVFLILAQKARSLRREVTIAGWLFKTARFTASDLRRRRRILQEREQAMPPEGSEPATAAGDAAWAEIDSLLNDALARLGERDRVAVLMRYFDEMSFAEIAAALGHNEDAVRHRVSRAVEKLRRILAARGATALPTAALAALLAENAVKPAPAHADSSDQALEEFAKPAAHTAYLHQLTQGILKAMMIKQVAAATAATLCAGALLGTGVGVVRAQRADSTSGAAQATSVISSPSKAVASDLSVAPRQVVVSFDLIDATPAMLAKAARSAGLHERGLQYKAALLAAGAKLTEAPIIVTTDKTQAKVDMGDLLLSDGSGLRRQVGFETAECTPTINADGTLSLAYAVTVTHGEMASAAAPVAIQGTKTLTSGNPLLVGSQVNSATGNGMQLLFATAVIKGDASADLSDSQLIRVGAIRITGNTVEPTAKLLALVSLKSGNLMTTESLVKVLQDSEQKILDVYNADGYRASMGEDVDVNPSTGTVTIPIVEARVSAVTVTGNNRVPTADIMAILAKRHVIVGGVYNDINLRKSLSALEEAYDFPNLGPIDLQTPDKSKVEITIPVKEKQ